MMKSEPQKEHRWLQELIGSWAYEHEAAMAPGEAPQKFRGTEKIRAIGSLWIVGEGEGDMPGGGKANTMITLGYDPQKQRFVGSWIGSMMSSMWVYSGQLDASGRVLTLDTEGPSMSEGGKLTKYQDIIEVKSATERTLTARYLDENGAWHHMMTAVYRRTG